MRSLDHAAPAGGGVEAIYARERAGGSNKIVANGRSGTSATLLAGPL